MMTRVIKAFLNCIGIIFVFAFKTAETDCPTSEWWTQLTNHVMDTLTIGDIDNCYRTCAAKPGCHSINYYRDKSLCELNSRTIENTPDMRVTNEDSVYFTIPVDDFTEWSNWTSCSLSCGNGTRHRNRSCTNPTPAQGGKNCIGPYSETQNCHTQPCPVQCDKQAAIGIQNKTVVSDYYITASNNTMDANKARLNGPEGWYLNCTGKPCTGKSWLQINVGKIAKITVIATQGAYVNNSRLTGFYWTEKYSLNYSNDGRTFTSYNNGQVFIANTDWNTIVYNVLTPAITARYVQIYPRKEYYSSGYLALRMELYECKGDEGVCSYALGMESRIIKDKHITASTTYSKYLPSWGRLNSGNGGWWAVGGDRNPWLQIDLLEIKMINGIATQGNWNHFAKEYHLEYRNATKNDLIKYTTNKVKVFQANSDGSSIVYNAIDPPIIAQIVRIVPKYEDHMTMRAELYGCPYMGSYDGSK